MKILNVNSCVKIVPVVMMALLSACNNGSKSTNNVPQNVQVAGVTNTVFQSIGNQSCNFIINTNSYSCSEPFIDIRTGQSQILTTQPNFFGSLQELCNKLRDDNYQGVNSVVVSSGSYVVASSVRQAYVNANCSAYSSTVGSTGINQYDTNLLKSMRCTLTVDGTDGSYGSTGEMQPLIFASGMFGRIETVMVRERRFWIFGIQTGRPSTNYINVNYDFKKGDSGRPDTLSLRGTIGDTRAEITGYAGSDVSLVIENVGPVQRAEVTCRVTDATNVGAQSISNDYRCTSSGTDNVEKAPQAVSIAELVANSLSFTSSDSSTNVSLAADGSFALHHGSAVFTATHNDRNESKKRSYMNIVGKANLSTPVKFNVKRISKTVEVSCK